MTAGDSERSDRAGGRAAGGSPLPEPTPSAERLLAAVVSRVLAEEDPLGGLARHGVPPAAVDSIVARDAPGLRATDAWQAAVANDLGRAARRDRASRLASAALAGPGAPAAFSRPILGPLWQSDVDVFVKAGDLAAVASELRGRGFLDLEPLLDALGRSSSGVYRLGALDDELVLGSVELCTRLYEGGPAVDEVLDRVRHGAPEPLPLTDTIRRRCAKAAAARKVTVRSALELSTLIDAHQDLPADPLVAVALRRCAALERKLICGDGPLQRLAPRRLRGPNVHWIAARLRRGARAAKRRLRPRRLTVTFSGIDGAGNGTRPHRLVESLERLDIPAAERSSPSERKARGAVLVSVLPTSDPGSAGRRSQRVLERRKEGLVTLDAGRDADEAAVAVLTRLVELSR